MLVGRLFFWLLPGRADRAADMLWMWREAWKMQLSDTKDKTEIPLVAGASDKGLTVVTGTRGWGGGGGDQVKHRL